MNDRPTPETTNEVNRGVATGETHSGRLLSMNTLARKLERERDELKEKIKILTSPSIEGVLTRMKGNLEIVDRIKTERDEAIREVAELRGQLAVCEEHAGTMAKDFDGIVEAIKGQRDELRAEVERLKAENVTFRNAQMCCEICDETITTESLRELRADNARLDWIIETCRPNIGKPDGMFYKALSRELIDADMKGDK